MAHEQNMEDRREPSEEAVDDLLRRVADCLEGHLHEYGWEPFRYSSGEHKGLLHDPRRKLLTLIGTNDLAITLVPRVEHARVVEALREIAALTASAAEMSRETRYLAGGETLSDVHHIARAALGEQS